MILDDLMESFAEEVVKIMLNVMRSDNQKNGECALRIQLDFQRKYTSKVSPLIAEFFDFMNSVLLDYQSVLDATYMVRYNLYSF